MRRIFSVLVENRSGVLCKVAGLFSRRSFNIDSLAVGETDDHAVSLMTIMSSGTEQTLEQIGVTPIEAVGKEFDPNFHNAVMHCEDDSVGENVIVQELQKGYMYRDSVVRHSMVKVAN